MSGSKADDDNLIHGGRFYAVTHSGRLLPLLSDLPMPPSLWICRRTADYAPAPIPAGAAFDVCSKCRAPIVFNPARLVDAPRVCLQCAGVDPLPL